jgi:hypothetical protein
MAYPALEVRGRRIILLSGYERLGANEQRGSLSRPRGDAQEVVVSDWHRLLDAANADRDAVAFGYTSGRWVAAA